MPVRKLKEIVKPISDTGNPNEFVYVEKSITKNMGDYNSAKVTVGIQTHLNPTEEKMLTVSHTITVLTEMVDTRLEKEVEQLLIESDDYEH